jgi:hypothetical protein
MESVPTVNRALFVPSFRLPGPDVLIFMLNYFVFILTWLVFRIHTILAFELFDAGRWEGPMATHIAFFRKFKVGYCHLKKNAKTTEIKE